MSPLRFHWYECPECGFVGEMIPVPLKLMSEEEHQRYEEEEEDDDDDDDDDGDM